MLLILIPGIFLTLDLHIYIDGDQPKYYQIGLAYLAISFGWQWIVNCINTM